MNPLHLLLFFTLTGKLSLAIFPHPTPVASRLRFPLIEALPFNIPVLRRRVTKQMQLLHPRDVCL